MKILEDLLWVKPLALPMSSNLKTIGGAGEILDPPKTSI